MTTGEETPATASAEEPRPERRGPRSAFERLFLRLVATIGIVGIGVGVGAILASNKVQGWIVGLVVTVVTLVLMGVLGSARPLKR